MMETILLIIVMVTRRILLHATLQLHHVLCLFGQLITASISVDR